MDSHHPEHTELLVIGAGPGGYVAAIRAAQHGIDVTLADADGIGGTCLNHGCIPSKALITATDRVHEAGQSTEMGIYSDPYVDVAEMIEWKNSIVDDLTTGVEDLCRLNDVTLVEGHVTFKTETSARVQTDNDDYPLEFENAIIATGSRPMAIDGFHTDDGPIIDARQALEYTEVPSRLVVIGAGYIGLELGTVFRKLGAEVTVIEMLDQALPKFEDDVSEVVERQTKSLGVDFQFEQAVTRWEQTDNGVRVFAEDGDEAEYTYHCDVVLVAVGRTPVTDTVRLDTLGIEPTDDGSIPTNAIGQTEIDHIYAVGDVAGEPMLAHKASAEGKVAADAIAGESVVNEVQAIPAVVFTDPEVATVGLTADAATECGYTPTVGRFPMSASGRAMTMGHENGFVRLIGDSDTGVLLGATIVGADAAELVAEVTVAIQNELTVTEIANTVHPHPTLSEAVMESAEGVFGMPIHWFSS